MGVHVFFKQPQVPIKQKSMVVDLLFTHVWRGPGTGLAYFGVVCGWIRETRSDLNA